MLSNKRPLALFEFGSWGHIPNYLRLIFEYWNRHEELGILHAVVGGELVNNHAAVFESLNISANDRIRISQVTAEEEKVIRRFNVMERGPEHAASETSNKYLFMWSLIQSHLAKIDPHHSLFLTLDDLMLPLCAGLRSATDFSGIFFRPFFQYQDAWAEATPSVGHLRSLPGRLLLNRFLRHPQLKYTFCIDETIADAIGDKVPCRLVYLPDPVRIPARNATPEEVHGLRRQLGIPTGKRVFLFFGDITERKGLWNLFEAISKLSDSDAAQMCVAIVGKAGTGTEARLSREISELSARSPISFVRRPEYVSEDELNRWIAASDVILAPYNKHVGMSGVLLLAAAHARPVISQEFGLMGNLTRVHELGQTCNPADPAGLAEALRKFLSGEPGDLWDKQRSAEFARSHSHEKFAETLFATLFPSR